MVGVLATVLAGGVAGCSTGNAQPGAGAGIPGPYCGRVKPDFSGIWQANNEAHWDLQAHAARAGIVTQEGVYPYEYARVPAAPVLALGAGGRRAGIDRRCGRRWRDSLQAGDGGDQASELRQLGRP